jgi:thioredoxin-related protein
MLVKKIFNILSFLLVLCTTGFTQEPAKQIPEFNFLRFNQTAFANKDLAPNKLLLFVFFDVECEHCRHAVKFIDEHRKDFVRTAIYLLTLDSKERASLFLNKYGGSLIVKKNVTLLQDYRQQFINKFKPRKYPSIFLYAENGELLLYDDEERNLPLFVQKIKDAGR